MPEHQGNMSEADIDNNAMQCIGGLFCCSGLLWQEMQLEGSGLYSNIPFICLFVFMPRYTGRRKRALPKDRPDQPLVRAKLHLDLGGEGPEQEEEGGAGLQANKEGRGGEE